MARPRKKIDAAQVKKLAQIGCSYAEIADIVGCDSSTLTRRFAQAIKEGHQKLKTSLRRKQVQVALSGNPSLLIWLGKQMLEQADKQEHSGPNGGPIPFKNLSDGDLDERIKKLTKELYGSEIDEAGRTGIAAAREAEAAGGK